MSVFEDRITPGDFRRVMAEATPEVLAPGELSLAELASEANREHELVREAGESMVEHAIRAGDALLAARDRCEPNRWIEWLRENWSAAIVTAHVYMRLARHKDEIRENASHSIVTARRHLTMIDATPLESRHGWRNPPTWVVTEAKGMRESGMSYAAIGRELAVPWGTVRYWLDPEYADRARVAARKRRAVRREAREREQAAATKRAARKAGGSIAAAYAAAERMQDILGQAHSEATDSEARAALSRAGVHYRKMRDEIVRALGVT